MLAGRSSHLCTEVATAGEYAFIYDGGIKKYWIVYNIHAIKADDLDILAQQLAAEHEVERTTMLRALLPSTVLVARTGSSTSCAMSLVASPCALSWIGVEASSISS